MGKDDLTIMCSTGTCASSDCCEVNPTCDNTDGGGAIKKGDGGTAFDSGSCDSGTHLKDDLTIMCSTGTCASSDCCEANPTCNNIDDSSTAFVSGSCDSGTHLKDDLTIMCSTDTCVSSDCCEDCDPVCKTEA